MPTRLIMSYSRGDGVPGLYLFIKDRAYDHPATPEVLEKQVEAWDHAIADWEHEAPWDAANQRSLRRLKLRRTKAEKAEQRAVNKEKELAIKKRRQCLFAHANGV